MNEISSISGCLNTILQIQIDRLIQWKFVKFIEEESNVVISSTNLQTSNQQQGHLHGAECYIWKRVFGSNGGLLQYLNTCRRENNIIRDRNGFDDEVPSIKASRWTIKEDSERFYWNKFYWKIFFRKVLTMHIDRLLAKELIYVTIWCCW